MQRHQDPFDGLRLMFSNAGLTERSFQGIAPGELIKREFDLAPMHGLSVGGVFEITAKGPVLYSETNNTILVGTMPLRSNKISMHIDGTRARTSRTAHLSKRAVIQSACTGSHLAAIESSIHRSNSRASQSQAAATQGDRLIEYFNNNFSTTRLVVSDVFQRMTE